MPELDPAIPLSLAAYWDQVLTPDERDAYTQEVALQRARALLGIGAVLGKLTDEATTMLQLSNLRTLLESMSLPSIQATAETAEQLANQIGAEPFTVTGQRTSNSPLGTADLITSTGVEQQFLTDTPAALGEPAPEAATEAEPKPEFIIPLIRINPARKMALGKVFGDSYKQLRNDVGDREAGLILDKLIDKYAPGRQRDRLKKYMAGKSDQQIIDEENSRTGASIQTSAVQGARSVFYRSLKQENLSFPKLLSDAQAKIQRLAAQGQIEGVTISGVIQAPARTAESPSDQPVRKQLIGLKNMFEAQADYATLDSLIPEEREYIINKMIEQFATRIQKPRLRAYLFEGKESTAIAEEESATTGRSVSGSAVQKGRSLFYQAVAENRVVLSGLIAEARAVASDASSVLASSALETDNHQIEVDTEPAETPEWTFNEDQARLVERLESRPPREQLMQQLRIFGNSVNLGPRENRDLREWLNEQQLQSLTPYIERALASMRKRYDVAQSRNITFTELEAICLDEVLGISDARPTSAFDTRRELQKTLEEEEVTLTDVLLEAIKKINSLVTGNTSQPASTTSDT